MQDRLFSERAKLENMNDTPITMEKILRLIDDPTKSNDQNDWNFMRYDHNQKKW